MSLPPWREEPISKKHDRESFDCGEAALNEFLRQHARKSHEAGGARHSRLSMTRTARPCWASTASALIRGICPDARYREAWARPLRRAGLPPCATCRGQAIPRARARRSITAAAGRRCLRAAAEVGGVVLVIDAKNEDVAKWYASYGAMPLNDAPLTLLLPLATIAQALKAAGHGNRPRQPL